LPFLFASENARPLAAPPNFQIFVKVAVLFLFLALVPFPSFFTEQQHLLVVRLLLDRSHSAVVPFAFLLK
jgi:hypothetical protein